MTKSQLIVCCYQNGQKFKRISSTSSICSLNQASSTQIQKNRKISQSAKNKFIQLITKQNYSMKKASRIIGISYSTAKKLFTKFRKELQQKRIEFTSDHQVKKECSYRENVMISKKVQVICLIAGNFQQSQQKPIVE